MIENDRIPRSFSASALLVSVAGAVLLVFSFAQYPPAFTPQLGLLLVAALLSENFALNLPAFNVSLAFPLIISAIVLAGPAAAGMVASLCFTNLAELRARRPIQPLGFNFGQLVMAACAGGWTYLYAGGQILWSDGRYVPVNGNALAIVTVLAAAAALVAYAINIVLTSYAVATLRGHAPVAVARAMLSYLPTQLSLVLVGILIAQVLAASAIAFPLFILPLVLARQVYQRYEDLRSVYLDTVRSLVGALEAKDPYTRGHSERVAEYARMLGHHIGLDARSTEKLERAALLHDVGKLTMSAEVLTKPGRLDEVEMQSMRQHPDLGGRMVARIPPLRGLASSVRAHHERLDGSGYPLGLTADDIPMFARVLAVADAYDAMTSKRAYRGAMTHTEATRELQAGAGTQFDPVLVDAFIACLEDTSEELIRTSTSTRVASGEMAAS